MVGGDVYAAPCSNLPCIVEAIPWGCVEWLVAPRGGAECGAHMKHSLSLHGVWTGLLTTICLACSGGAALAGQITQTTGTLSNGSTLTITGSGFGSKTNAKPLYYWDFETSTTTSPLSRNSYSGGIRGTLSTSMKAVGSVAALGADIGGITEAFGPIDGVPFNSDSLFIWVKRNYAFDLIADKASNGINLKFFRLWYPWTHDIYTNYQANDGPTSGRTVAEVTGIATKWWPMPFEGKKWIIEEYEYMTGDVGVENGILNYTRGGRAAYAKSTRFRTRTSSASNQYSLLFFDQISNNLVTPGKYIYYDALYVDDTWQRVFISDEPTWQNVVYGSGGSERVREIQIPISWTDTKIEISIRQGQHGQLAGKYLYVIGKDGNAVNATGFALAGTKAPLPPESLSVQ